VFPNITIRGFHYGIVSGESTLGYAQNSFTLEHIFLSGQSVLGWVNFSQPTFARELNSVNSIPAIQNNRHDGRITVITARLKGVAHW
jgi:hypothetical protein